MYAVSQANRWLSLRLELMGESVVFLTAVMASVLLQANAGLAGLAITSSLNMCGFLNWMVRSVSEMEVRLVLSLFRKRPWMQFWLSASVGSLCLCLKCLEHHGNLPSLACMHGWSSP